LCFNSNLIAVSIGRQTIFSGGYLGAACRQECNMIFQILRSKKATDFPTRKPPKSDRLSHAWADPKPGGTARKFLERSGVKTILGQESAISCRRILARLAR
jgi:hypothetical protein